MYPALAVARALRDVRRDVELDYIGGVRGFERRLVASHELRHDLHYHELVVRSLRSAGLSAHTVLDPLRLAGSVPQAWWLLGRTRPAALFTTGGYLAVPLVLAARAHLEHEGAQLRLAQPAGPALVALLDRAGFLGDPQPADIDFWFHGELPQ